MRKLIIFAIILILILASIITIMASTLENSGQNLSYTHSHTKAICDSENFCQDYEIFCYGKTPLKMSPITGASVQFSENWQDPRDEEIRKKVC